MPSYESSKEPVSRLGMKAALMPLFRPQIDLRLVLSAALLNHCQLHG